MSKNNMLDGAQVIVDYLIQQKVPYAFGLCGHGNIQFIDALFERQSEIKTISTHHESVCGFMADVYYRVKGQPVATFTSCGPGSVNLPISLATAYLEYLYSPEGQTILAKAYNRVYAKSVVEKFKDKFPDVKLYRVEDEFGGWDKLTADHLASGAKLDQLFGGR